MRGGGKGIDADFEAIDALHTVATANKHRDFELELITADQLTRARQYDAEAERLLELLDAVRSRKASVVWASHLDAFLPFHPNWRIFAWRASDHSFRNNGTY